MKCKDCGTKTSFIDWIIDWGKCWHCKSLDYQFGKSKRGKNK